MGLLILTWKVTDAKIIAFLKLLQMSITLKQRFLLSSHILLYVYVQQGVEQARQETKSIRMTGFAGKAPV